MKILVTGVAGFIGAAVTERLLKEGKEVIGVDKITDYYSPELKYDRLSLLGIDLTKAEYNKEYQSWKYKSFSFYRIDLANKESTRDLFKSFNFDVVIHFAAQPGVRFSFTNPQKYIEDNISSFINVVEGCRENHTGHFIFASSSSVYGLNKEIPFSEDQRVDYPISLYAATKRSNELIAHAYAYNFHIPTTGLRFFSVYGPWGRPDMSPFLFIDGIINGKPIKVFNNGEMFRDFTYIDDVVESVIRIIEKKPEGKNGEDEDITPYKIYNVGNHHPIKILDYIETIESELGKEAKKEMLPMQLGEIYQTYADTTAFTAATGFTPSTSLKEGIKRTIEWYKSYYKS